MHSIGWVPGNQQEAQGSGEQKAVAAAPMHQQPQPAQDTQPTQMQQRFSVAQPTGQYGQPLSSPAVVAAPAAAAAPVVMPATPVGAPRSGVPEPSWGASAKPAGAGRGVRSRKLEMDFDFEKEAALLAAKQRAAAQGEIG